MSSKVAWFDDSVAALSLMAVNNSRGSRPNYGYTIPSNEPLRPAPDDRRRVRAVLGTGASADAEKVLRSFNTWAFKREQPSDLNLLRRFISDAISTHEPIPFVLYWGKGPRHETAAPEIQCLDFLCSMGARVRGAYAPGAAFKLILTDTHAELNGHSQYDISRYFKDIESLARKRDISTCWLSHLVQAARAAGVATAPEQNAAPDILSSLAHSAAKWYRGAGTAEEGARIYFRMNLFERMAVQASCPRSIFVTFNGSGLRSLFPPQLPIFYMYSLRRGIGVKPWFLPAEPATPPLSADPKKALHPV